MKLLVIWIINPVAYISMPFGKKRTQPKQPKQSKKPKQPIQTLLDLQTRFNTLGLYRPERYIWRCKARLQKYMEDCMCGDSPRIWDKPPTPVFFTYMGDQPSALPTYPPFPLLGSPIITKDMSAVGSATEMVKWSQSLQGGQAAVSSPIAGWNSPSMQGGQAAVSSPIAGWNSPSMQGGQAEDSIPMPRSDSNTTAQLPVDCVSSPTSPGWKVPLYAEWPNCTF